MSLKMTSSDAHLKPGLNPNIKDKYPEVDGSYPYQGTAVKQYKTWYNDQQTH